VKRGDTIEGVTGVGPFSLLATVGDLATAQLYAARLRAEGIESRLLGESLGPYRLTVGEMAETQVWVPEGRLTEARRLLELPGADPADG
jgi:hypothetical protein